MTARKPSGPTGPVIADNLVSVFALYNPPNSAVMLELIDLDLVSVLATTVVGGVGLYYSNQAQTAAATLTTQDTVQSGIVGNPPGNQAQFYSALTHSGTPTPARILAGFGATSGAFGDMHYEFNGKVIIPPAIVASIAMTTAAGTSSGLTLSMSWAELPL